MSAVQALLLAVCCCSPLVLGVIHDIDGRDDLVEPIAVEISPDDHLGSVAESVLGRDFSASRSRRQANGTHFGTTVRLNGTNRHYFALVHWTGHPSEVLFIVTMTRRNNPIDSCVWRSTDYGMTFTNDSYKLNDSSAVISWYYVSPYDQYLVMADTLQDKIFVTRDEGVTFAGRQLQFTPNKIKFQGVTVPKSAVGTLPLHMMGYETETQSLYVSKDLGDTWVYLGSNISRYSWRNLDAQYESNTSLYFERNINDMQALLMTSRDPYSDADTRELDPELGHIKINSTVLNHEYILVQKLDRSDLVPLWVSAYRRPFQQANFQEPMEQAHYAVMDASEHRVFLAVEHANSSNVHLYISDRDGASYSLSLDRVVATEDWGNSKPSFDIHVVEGMDGVYMVNVYDRHPDGEGETNNVRTLISYNKGALWRQLTPPTVDSRGQPVLCQPPLCSLHLRMDTDTALGYSSIRSKRSAVGLIVAQGNVGEGLVGHDGRVSVYVSRDGGFSWSEVQRGNWTFQLVALGSVIVMAPKRTTVDPLNYVIWSCDEGVTWTKYIFTPTPMRLIGLLAQKGEKARRLTLFGYFRGVSPFAWLIVDLDFSVAVPNQCSHPDDYFHWLPSDGRSDRRCVLGAEKTYERRNGSACCYINPDYERAIKNVSCHCSREDYECDVGYRPDTLGGRCVGALPPPPNNCTEGGVYLQPSGYRKVVGTICTDLLGSQFLHTYVPCPPVAPGSLGLELREESSILFDIDHNLTFVLSQHLGWVRSTRYIWDFGDGASATGTGLEENSVKTHRYASRGLYAVHVRADNLAGSSTVSLEVSIGAIPPTIGSFIVRGDFSGPGKDITFTVVVDEGFAAVYEWDFGDGLRVKTSEHATTETQTHAYTEHGVYTVRVTVSNPAGSSSTSLVVHVGEVLPQGLNVTVEGDTSKPGQKLSFTLTQETGLTKETVYRWDFGDDSKVVEKKGLEAAARQTHTYSREGRYTVRVTASNEGGMSSVFTDISIGNMKIQPPVVPVVDKLTGSSSKDEEKNNTGLGVGVALLVLLIILVAGASLVVLFWYRKRYVSLQGQYKALQEGTGTAPMALSISASELQEDLGYSKESEADDKALVSDNGEL